MAETALHRQRMCYSSGMSPSSGTRTRERRCLLLAEEGSHSWLGRNTNPDEEDLSCAKAALTRAGVGGWVAISEGDYWGKESITLLQVRELNHPKVSFEIAVDAFQTKRRHLINGLSFGSEKVPLMPLPSFSGP